MSRIPGLLRGEPVVFVDSWDRLSLVDGLGRKARWALLELLILVLVRVRDRAEAVRMDAEVGWDWAYDRQARLER